jgi:alkylation response protein AidB-like acyl-CoA dehydrogenase
VLSDAVPAAASHLFDALGASGVSVESALDRHWRNARTVASHNPQVFKRRIVGEWVLNGTPPPTAWAIGVAPGTGDGHRAP